MWTASFWKDAGERAVKTFAQALLATMTVGTSIVEIDWAQGAGIPATAAAMSILTSIGSSGVGDKGTAGLVSVEGGA